MLRLDNEQERGLLYAMGRADDAPAVRSLVVPRMRSDRISPQLGQAEPLLSLRLASPHLSQYLSSCVSTTKNNQGEFSTYWNRSDLDDRRVPS